MNYFLIGLIVGFILGVFLGAYILSKFDISSTNYIIDEIRGKKGAIIDINQNNTPIVIPKKKKRLFKGLFKRKK